LQALGERSASALPELTAMLNQPATADVAISALGCIGQPAVPVLLRTLGHTNSEVRMGAIVALMGVTPVTTEVLDGVVGLTEDPAFRVRQIAVRYVGGATNHLARTLPVLVGKLKDSDPRVRYVAIVSFKLAGDKGREFIPNLMELLCDNPSRSALAVLHQELKTLGASSEIVVPCLIRALDSSDVSVRNSATQLLSTYGRGALPALPRLRQRLEQTTDIDERARLTDAVTKIESPEKPAAGYATNLPPRRPYSRPTGPPPIRPQ